MRRRDRGGFPAYCDKFVASVDIGVSQSLLTGPPGIGCATGSGGGYDGTEILSLGPGLDPIRSQHRMAMQETTIRFSASTYARLQAEAAREGVSAAQYVRELVVAHFARLDATDRPPDRP